MYSLTRRAVSLYCIQSILDSDTHIIVLRTDLRRRMPRINTEIPDHVHARLRMLASAEGIRFYEWVKELLVGACPDEQTLTAMLRDIRGS